MSHVRTSKQSVDELIEELLRQSEDTAYHETRRLELIAWVQSLEAKYGIKSSDIHDAIEDGRLDETHEVTQWIMDYELLRRFEESSAG